MKSLEFGGEFFGTKHSPCTTLTKLLVGLLFLRTLSTVTWPVAIASSHPWINFQIVPLLCETETDGFTLAAASADVIGDGTGRRQAGRGRAAACRS